MVVPGARDHRELGLRIELHLALLKLRADDLVQLASHKKDRSLEAVESGREVPDALPGGHPLPHELAVCRGAVAPPRLTVRCGEVKARLRIAKRAQHPNVVGTGV